MCDVKTAVPLGAIAAGLGAAVVAVHMAPALDGFLVTALVTVYGACMVSGVLLWRILRPAKARTTATAVRQPRALPAPPRAIEAPKTAPVYVITDARALNPTDQPKAGAR